MMHTELATTGSNAIQWPQWTDAFSPDVDYVGLTARILCGLSDGLCDDCQGGDPVRSQYGAALRAALPRIWPRGPLEMIGEFNAYSLAQGMPEGSRVRDPVSSAFAKLTEHAAFWAYVKAVLRESGMAQPAAQPTVARREVWDDWDQDTWTKVKQFACGAPTGAVNGPPPFKQETNMASEIVNPFGAGALAHAGELAPSTEATEETSPWWGIAAGFGLIVGAGYFMLKVAEHAQKNPSLGDPAPKAAVGELIKIKFPGSGNYGIYRVNEYTPSTLMSAIKLWDHIASTSEVKGKKKWYMNNRGTFRAAGKALAADFDAIPLATR